MRDFSINLPSRAVQSGYTLEGLSGTYDDLDLKKDGKLVQRFLWNEVPNIFGLEVIIDELESKETQPRGPTSF